MKNKDFLITAISKDKNIHGYFCNIKNSAAEICSKHSLNIISTTILTRALIGSVLLSGNLKNDKDFISIIWNCTGIIKKIFCEVWYNGNTRGYVENKNPELIKNSIKDDYLYAEPYIGFGELKLLRTTFDNRAPYSSVIPIETGEIAQDISSYLDQAFQIQSALKLGFSTSKENIIETSGGVLLTAMPGAEKQDLEKIYNGFNELGTLTEILNKDNKDINGLFEKLELNILNIKEINFKCLCSKRKVFNSLSKMQDNELEKYLSEGNKIEVECHFCSEKYSFTKDDFKI